MARIALLICLGCISGYYINNPFLALVSYTISILSGILILRLSLLIKTQGKFNTIKLSILINVFFITSFATASYYDSSNSLSRVKKIVEISTPQQYYVQVASEPRFKNGRLSVKCQLLNHPTESILQFSDESILLVIDDGYLEHFQLGDRKCVYGILKQPNANLLPDSFNYKQFLRFQGIEYILSAKDTNVYALQAYEQSLLRISFQWRNALLKRMPKSIIDDKERQVASALLLGERSEMQRDIVQLYSSGGIIHILAVSGLHVGLLYQALLFLLNWVKWLKKRNVHLILILLILWIYAFMTGLSPSVNRAVCMFTLVTLSGVLNRSVSAYNHIGSAAFLLILITPNAIFDLGFLLSFSAVLGIIGARPILDKLNLIGNKGIRILCIPIVISIAAQLATLPITLFSFGTFPVWFLPANLIAVPLSTLLTYIGLASLVLADIPFIGDGMMHIFSCGIVLLNNWAKIIGHLPYSQLSGLTISICEFVLISMAIYLLFRSIHGHKIRSLYYICLFLFLACLSSFFRIEINRSTCSTQIYAYHDQLHIRSFNNLKERYYVVTSSTLPLKNYYYPFLENNVACNFHYFIAGKKTSQLKSSPIIYEKQYYVISKSLCIVFSNMTDADWQLVEKNQQADIVILPAPWMLSTHKNRLKAKCKMKNFNYYDLKKDGCIEFIN